MDSVNSWLQTCNLSLFKQFVNQTPEVALHVNAYSSLERLGRKACFLANISLYTLF